MHITIINDCRDANALGRQLARAASLIGGSVSGVGVSSDTEASGNLIDILDAYEEREGIVLVNVAPRNGSAKKWENGTPFGYFWYKHILVVASIDGYTLSLVKKLKLIEHLNVLDIPTALREMHENGTLTPESLPYITNTQFRSYDFLPRVAAHLLTHQDILHEKLTIEEMPDVTPQIWWVDNFGNCKTTLLEYERVVIETAHDERLRTLPFIQQLKDVPDNTAALTIGSSGIGSSRFLEIVVQGGSASAMFGFVSGVEL